MVVMIGIRKYRQSRHWAVYVDGELLAAVTYWKGAQAIADMLMRIQSSKQAEDAALAATRPTHPLRPVQSCGFRGAGGQSDGSAVAESRTTQGESRPTARVACVRRSRHQTQQGDSLALPGACNDGDEPVCVHDTSRSPL